MRIFLVTVLLCLVALPVSAQEFLNQDSLSLTLSPQYPRPFQDVTVRAESTLIDLNRATLRFFVNGKSVEGETEKSIQFAVGASGVPVTVRAEAVVDGQTYSKELSITPADVSLVLEADTTAHPLYEGMKLPAANGRVRLIALSELRDASGNVLSPQNLVYTWRNGEQILNEYSGIGKNVFVAAAPPRFRDATIRVTVSTLDGTMTGETARVVAAVEPFIRIYRQTPLLGALYQWSIGGSYRMQNSEDSFVAVPYFFPETPRFVWKVGGRLENQSPILTLRQDEGTAGEAVVEHTLTLPSGEALVKQFTVLFGLRP